MFTKTKIYNQIIFEVRDLGISLDLVDDDFEEKAIEIETNYLARGIKSNIVLLPTDIHEIDKESKAIMTIFIGEDSIEFDEIESLIKNAFSEYTKDQMPLNLRILFIVTSYEKYIQALLTLIEDTDNSKKIKKIITSYMDLTVGKIELSATYLNFNPEKKSKFMLTTDGNRFGYRSHFTEENKGSAIQPDMSNAIGHIAKVKLSSLTDMFIDIGPDLFSDNLRLRISDKLGVESAIEQTLENDNHSFWFNNNGITMLVESGCVEFDSLNSISVSDGKKKRISVINGAQTLSSSAKYISKKQYKYKQAKDLYDNKVLKMNEDEKKELENIKNELAKTQKKIDKINDSTFVLLKIIEVPVSNANGKSQNKFVSETTIALNRQKPIQIDDIAYRSASVSQINSYNGLNFDKDWSFQLIRRGEEESIGNKKYFIEDYARVATSIFCDDPGRARSSGRDVLLKVDQNWDFVNGIFPHDHDKYEDDDVMKKIYSIIPIAMENFEIVLKERDKYVKSLTSKLKKLENKEDPNFIKLDNKKRFVSYSAYLVSYIHLCSLTIDNKFVDDKKAVIYSFNQHYETMNANFEKEYKNLVEFLFEEWQNGKINNVDSNDFKNGKELVAFKDRVIKQYSELLMDK